MLKGKTIFVSGGTGFLGEAIIRKLVENQAKIVFSYNRNTDKADELVNFHPNISKIKLNILKLDDIKEKINRVIAEHGDIDILINNAGVAKVMPFSLLEEEDFDLTMDINVKGTFFLTKAVLRNMIRNKAGNIINIGSIAGQRMFEVPIHYAASKAAISGFTYALASEVKKFKIRVNSVVPGMLEGGVASGIAEKQKEDFVDHCATGRPGTADEVANVVCFMASDQSSYINAQNIYVDGGI